MSWPTDGKPRYILVETVGNMTAKEGPVGKGPSHRTFAILDRAFCHCTLWLLRTEEFRQLGRDKAIARVRAIAEQRLAELNAEQVAA